MFKTRIMERLIEYCKATTKEIESSFVQNFTRTELQKFNSRVDRAYAEALNLDRMTQESFTKMIPKDMNNNTPSCSGRESGDPVDGLKSKGRILGFLKRHGRNIREFENNTRKEIDLHKENPCDAIEHKGKDVPVCKDDDGHFIPRKLLLFKVEKFKGESDGRLGVRKSTKTFRAPVPNCARSTAIEVLDNERDGRHRVRKSTKTFRAPDPNFTRSAAIEDSWWRQWIQTGYQEKHKDIPRP